MTARQSAKRSILVTQENGTLVDYGATGQDHRTVHLRFRCISCNNAIIRRRSFLFPQENDDEVETGEILYLNLQSNSLYRYPPASTHAVGCEHSAILPPLPQIDFMITTSANLLLRLTADTPGAHIVYGFFRGREVIYIGMSNSPRHRFFAEIKVIFSLLCYFL